MKAKLKINYTDAKKGSVFNMIEAQGSRITLDINGKSVDFGFSEVSIIAETDQELCLLGHNILNLGKRSIAGWREVDVSDYIKQINLPITKSLMRKAVNRVIWG